MLRVRTAVAVVLTLVPVVLLGIAMRRTSYEVWGGLVAIPILGAVALVVVHRMVRNEFPALFPILAAGFAAKAIGAVLRFYVFTSVYDGSGDANYYYDNARRLAEMVRQGSKPASDLIPWTRDLGFVIRLSGAIVYAIGPTRLGTFLVFATLGYLGAVFLVIAACRAVPGLAQRRYAWLCMLVPTIVFWPSSLGKEAWVLFGVGITALGLSRIFTWTHPVRGLVCITLGSMAIGAVRLHLAAILLASGAVAFVQTLLLPSARTGRRSRGGAALVAITSLVIVGALSVAVVRKVDLSGESNSITSSLGNALTRVESMSSVGNSAYTPPNIRNPLNWPYAVARTLTRPLPTDVEGLPSLFATLETTLFLLALFASYRRLARLPAMMRRYPYATFATVTVVLTALAFSTFGNLGILVRQRSLIAPFLLLLLCLPQSRSKLDAASPPGDLVGDQRVRAASRA